MTTNRTPWTPTENGACVRLYFDMLDAEQLGERYIKAHCVKAYQGQPQPSQPDQPDAPLANRSRPSIEFKLMNCSAAHADLSPGAETMDAHGYRAMPNYQASLRDEMRAELRRRDIAEQSA